MNLTLFVHDCFLEIGHSNAMIETLRKVPQDKISKLTIVAYTCDDPQKLFPELLDHVNFHKVPFPFLKPVLLKVLFFHFYTWLYSIFSSPSTHISIGIASLQADIINLQFVHKHWRDFFFKQRKLSLVAKVYKKILFKYFIHCETKIFNRKPIHFSSLSQYVTDYCLENFDIAPERIETVYSAVNLEKYSLKNIERHDLYEELLLNYPSLKHIDPSLPIYLFVGAYERKGLQHALRALCDLDNPQLILVGRPEANSNIVFPDNIKIAKIEFTKELPLFYQLADTFVFPTHYEPYGLVISEAAAMGMRVYTTVENVGASEILTNISDIHLYSKPEDLVISNEPPLSFKEKQSLRDERINKVFKQHSWDNAGLRFYEICKKSISDRSQSSIS